MEENKKINFKKALSELLKRSQASKIDQQEDTNLKSEHSHHSANLLGNESEVNLEVQEPMDEILKTVSEDKIRPVTPLSHSQKHKKYCKAEFRTNYTKYWPGTTISFSGKHTQFFYETIKYKQLNKDIFDLDSTNIGRIDLCYDQKIQQSDYIQTLDSFLKNSCTKINSKVDDPKAEVVKGVFRVGKPSSPNYFRVYPKSNGKFIRFELELKKSAIKRFQSYFFFHQFEKWKELLTCHFYKEAMNKLDLDSLYTDWLIENSRQFCQLNIKRKLSNYFFSSE